MPRVKRGENAHRRHRKVVKAAKGYRGLRSTNFRAAKNAVMKAGLNSYTHRRTKKREFRKLWIARINAACRPLGISYSVMINGLSKKDVMINRKMLAELAATEPKAFEAVVAMAK
ncbi:50S ribosomal protein L20 [Candidatus Peregrinibacteria bacterium CG10_big_fil_rev_8_21_14_0_10_36_19]|nr:MAG: 50S ribosomal protein L20 [Candidatus Peregrinibacteria bacterium CG10_big_fil_rev_8_21_14_0_10_36_19]